MKKEHIPEALKTLPEGTPVILTNDLGEEERTRTCSSPWQLGHGAWVVKVKGRAGGYNLSRIRPIE